MKVGGKKSSEHQYRVLVYRAEYLKALRVLEERPDWLIYKPVLVKTIRVMWAGIISSFKYTNSDYLSILDGRLSNKNLPRWMKSFAEQLAHNNNAESPFAVAKWLARVYPSLGLDKIYGTVNAIKNHTHCSGLTNSKGEVIREAGAVFTADEVVREVVSELADKKSDFCKKRREES